jgi:SAM-dependent methyltransferase
VSVTSDRDQSEQNRERKVRDAQAADYESVRRRAYFRWFEITERRALLEILRPPLRGWLLDAGCSTGRLTPVLGRTAQRVVSVDFSLGSLRFASRQHPSARYLQADISALPFRKAFSAVVCLDVLPFIPISKRIKVLTAFREALCEGGRIVATTWNRESFSKIFSLPPEGRFKSGIYYQSMSEDETADLFRKAGFSDVKVTGLGHFLIFIRSHRCTATLYRFLGWTSIPWELALTRRGGRSWQGKSLYHLITARK